MAAWLIGRKVTSTVQSPNTWLTLVNQLRRLPSFYQTPTMDQCSIRVGAGIAPFIILIVTRAKVGLPMILWEDISPTVKIKNPNVN